ncbi:hypothetical protein D3C80_1722380 [compost metagenome]
MTANPFGRQNSLMRLTIASCSTLSCWFLSTEGTDFTLTQNRLSRSVGSGAPVDTMRRVFSWFGLISTSGGVTSRCCVLLPAASSSQDCSR